METPHIELTDEARTKFVEFLAAEDKDGLAIYLAIRGYGPGGFQYVLDIIDEKEAEDGDVAVDLEDFKMMVEHSSAERLDGVKIDFLQRGLDSGFHVSNPNGQWKDPVSRAVQELLDSQINPSVANHGGWVALRDEVRDGVAYITFGGGCQGCGMADVTLKQGVEAAILEAIPGVRQVKDGTDHDAGENPYYAPQADGGSPFA
jgi:Fe/S biogenesis protein NfuA